jgi:hypothetical protein
MLSEVYMVGFIIGFILGFMTVAFIVGGKNGD